MKSATLADDPLGRALDAVADGDAVDWPALLGGSENGEARERLKAIEILHGVANFHRDSSWQDAESSAAATVRPEPRSGESATRERAETWGRYELLEKVGQGSFGSVYRAWDPELEREIAIKILHDRAGTREVKARLLGEGRVLARLQHPNVVRVFGVESHGDRVGLCMEFVHGETLDGVVRRQGLLNAREALLVGEDVCRALSAVHAAGFVHRDVKAKNVMREKTGRIVLMDFGTGRDTEQAARAGWMDLAGTPLYMAPEVLDGEPATPASDVYSVGVLLYELVTGAYPVEGRTFEELVAAQRERRYRLLTDRRSDLEAPFVQVVTRALSPVPGRYPTAGACLEALRAASGELAGRRWVEKYLRPPGIAAGVLLCVAGLGMLSTLAFDVSLGRSGFATAGVGDALYWGARSCVGPAISLLMGLAAIGLLNAIRRLLLAASDTLRRCDAALCRRLGGAARRCRLNETPVIASYALLACASALVLAWWYFSPLLGAMVTSVPIAPVESLRLLAPGSNGAINDYHVNYRITFTWIAIVSILAWGLIVRRARRERQALQPGVLAGGVGVIVLALGSLDYPFRLLYHNQFDAVRYEGETCYILGERADDVLLFCPSMPPPRNRIVKQGEGLQRTGVRESILTRFAQGHGMS
jgi:hypothetical protein